MAQPRSILTCLLFMSMFLRSATGETKKSNNETEAREFLKDYGVELEYLSSKLCDAKFDLATNITSENEMRVGELSEEDSVFSRKMAGGARKFDVSENSTLPKDLVRQLKMVLDIGPMAQTNQTKLERLNNISFQMENIYNTGKVCLKGKGCLDLTPGLIGIMANSRDYDELLAVWKGWRDAVGPPMKDLYVEGVDLYNEALALSGWKDAGEYWRSMYETPTFEEDVRNLYEQIRPLYEHLHGYVRRRLKKVYGEDKFPSTGHIPAHLLGDMWSQHWDHVYEFVEPFEGKVAIDVTDEMIKQNYTVSKMFRTAEDFYKSIGFPSMTNSFWKKSMFEKPTDGRGVDCHGAAWDCKGGTDFRIKMCTVVNHRDLMTIHHEMGHVEYYMLYKNQPAVYKGGANPGFHEAVGDVMTLSVQTPEHLQKIKLISNYTDDDETDINFLMEMALQKVAFLPFGYLIDQWRWSVFRGDTKPDEYTRDWWNLRCRYQGVSSPVERKVTDFDPGAKHHVPMTVPYIRYFVSYLIQFQFHKAACDAAGYKGPLHRCDIYNNKAAGDKLKSMLELGASKPWPEAMKKLTGKSTMDAQPILEYFKPLLDYLRKENGNDYGWQPQCPTLAKAEKVLKCSKETNGAEKVQLSVAFSLIISVVLVMIL